MSIVAAIEEAELINRIAAELRKWEVPEASAQAAAKAVYYGVLAADDHADVLRSREIREESLVLQRRAIEGTEERYHEALRLEELRMRQTEALIEKLGEIGEILGRSHGSS